MRTLFRFNFLGSALRTGGRRAAIESFKRLQGDPHCISRGMAIGVFIGTTPTFPFHTVIAVLLALLLRGSAPAAALGVWFGNPLTMPFFYVLSYKIGMWLLGTELPAVDFNQLTFAMLAQLGVTATCALLAGGFVLGMPFAAAAYGITYRLACLAVRRVQHPETLE